MPSGSSPQSGMSSVRAISNTPEAVSIVAIGKYQGTHFEASQLLVKCPSKYQAESDKGAEHPDGVPREGVTS